MSPAIADPLQVVTHGYLASSNYMDSSPELGFAAPQQFTPGSHFVWLFEENQFAIGAAFFGVVRHECLLCVSNLAARLTTA